MGKTLQGNPCDMLMCHDSDWETLRTISSFNGLEFWTDMQSILFNYLEKKKIRSEASPLLCSPQAIHIMWKSSEMSYGSSFLQFMASG